MVKTYTFIILAFLVGTILGWRFFKPQESSQKCNNQYEFLSNKIDCTDAEDTINQLQNTKNNIQTIIDKEKQAGNIEAASVFFRDLNTTQWFGINENTRFHPASIGKLPIAMMYYKIAEVRPPILTTNITIDETYGNANDSQRYPPQQAPEPGKTYPVAELLRFILTYSDNISVTPLLNEVRELKGPILTDLGIYDPAENNSDGAWNFTAKTYANLFRILYNSSYLKPEYSNIVLDHLAHSQFNSGLVKGVPDRVRISHKFGIATLIDKNSEQTKKEVLNDCGIVYKKDNPYILCIMTQGKNLQDLEDLIQTISKSVYEDF